MSKSSKGRKGPQGRKALLALALVALLLCGGCATGSCMWDFADESGAPK